MARGWESKSVEMQMEDREKKPRPTGKAATGDPALQRELGVLELSRKRLLAELDAVGDHGDHRFRILKRRALAHVDAAIAAVTARLAAQ
jgi:hypothetical protein